MKIKKLSLLTLFSLLALSVSACMSGSGSSTESEDTVSQPVNSQSPITRPPSNDAPQSTNNSNLSRLSMHYSLLKGQPHIWNETGGIKWLNLSQSAAAGASSIRLNSTAGLIQQQLITYKGRNNQYYVSQIQSIRSNTLQLTTPLEQAVNAGSNVWNFYEDGAHPNRLGYTAVADFSVRRLGFNRLNQGKHVLLGDSWFSEQIIFNRLKQRLSGATISNKGIGGNTSGNLLARFDADVSWQNPNYVWILAGSNDVARGVTATNYKSNLRKLVNKVRAIGAVPIVFDSAVAPMHYGSDQRTRLSRSYVTAVDQLIREY